MSRYVSYKLETAEAATGHMRWSPLGEVYARMTPMRHRVTLRRGTQVQIATHEARLRFSDTVQAGQRLRRHDRIFVIHAVEPMGRRQSWLSCLCEEKRPLAPVYK